MVKKSLKNLRHFIDLDQIKVSDLKSIIALAKKLKAQPLSKTAQIFALKNLAMIFEKNSTRTRLSFEVAINQLGGKAIVMNKSDMQLDRGETISDTAKILSSFVDIVMIRCKDHQMLLEMAANSSCPIINGLSNYSHPCQIMASILTITEKLGAIKNKKLVWFGDANNVLNSYIHAAKAFDYELVICIPKNFNFCDNEIQKAQKNGARIIIDHNPSSAAKNADVIITETWISMGDNAEQNQAAREAKIKLLKPYQVNEKIMKLAKKTAIFTHCLPAHRGFEVSAEVIDGKASIVFDEAQNRLHIQKAIMLWLIHYV